MLLHTCCVDLPVSPHKLSSGNRSLVVAASKSGNTNDAQDKAGLFFDMGTEPCKMEWESDLSYVLTLRKNMYGGKCMLTQLCTISTIRFSSPVSGI